LAKYANDPTKKEEVLASFKGLKSSNLWNPDFFYKTTLERTENIDTTGSLNGRLVFCLFLSYVILYFSAWKGVKSTGKMVWVTCTLPYVILTILFIKGLTLEGAGKGLKFLFIPEWSKLGEAKIW
jgi:SNF family Na+-dependent transporter